MTMENMLVGLKEILGFLRQKANLKPHQKTLQRWARCPRDPFPMQRLRGALVAFTDQVLAWVRRNLRPMVTA